MYKESAENHFCSKNKTEYVDYIYIYIYIYTLIFTEKDLRRKGLG